ncbi:MAG TPA: DUF4129 domain-containing protein [Nitrososphaerales archaeon]|nr:DUF4129 domain-containing protein [Nitrososphaerales archaeon]
MGLGKRVITLLRPRGNLVTSKLGEERKKKGAPIFVVVAALCLIIFPILVAFAYYSSRNLLPVVANLQFNSPSPPPQTLQEHTLAPTMLNGTLLPIIPNFSFPNIPPVTYVVIYLLLAALVVSFAFIRTFRIMRACRIAPFSNKEAEGELLQEEREKVASILDQTVRELRSDSNYREAVIRCYKLIAQTLEARSAIDGRSLTASEFREVISDRLKFDSPYLSKATTLFEIARYSEHEITREDALEASECLSGLSESLRQHVAPL